MKITDVRVRKIENQNRLRGVASITIDDAFVIHEIRVIEGAKGIFVAMPSRKNKFGVFKDLAHPINTETRAEVEKAVLDEFNKEVENVVLDDADKEVESDALDEMDKEEE